MSPTGKAGEGLYEVSLMNKVLRAFVGLLHGETRVERPAFKRHLSRRESAADLDLPPMKLPLLQSATAQIFLAGLISLSMLRNDTLELMWFTITLVGTQS